MKENHEILSKALELTLAVYRLTGQLPREEILIYMLRRLSVELIGDLRDDNFDEAKKKIELLLMYFKISRLQKWVKDINWLILENEHRTLMLNIQYLSERGESEESAKTIILKNSSGRGENIVSHNIFKKKKSENNDLKITNLSSRQQIIYNEIQTKKTLKMANLVPLFKDQASERTLRNDLKFLLDRGLIKKTGSHKSTLYSTA